MSSWYFRMAPSVSADDFGRGRGHRARAGIWPSRWFRRRRGDLNRSSRRQALDEGHHLARQGFGGFGARARRMSSSRSKDGVVDPVIEAAALQRVVHLARAVRGEDDDGRFGALDGAKFGDGDLEVRQGFQQEGLERLVGAVDLVDQKDGRAAGLRAHGGEERAFDQVVGVNRSVFSWSRSEVPARRCGWRSSGRRSSIRRRRRRRRALRSTAGGSGGGPGGGEGLGDLGLAGAGLAFQEQRAAEFEGQEDDRGQRAARIGGPPLLPPNILAGPGSGPARAAEMVIPALGMLGLLWDGRWTAEAECVLWRGMPAAWGLRFETDQRFLAAADAAVASMPGPVRDEIDRLTRISAADVAACVAQSARAHEELAMRLGRPSPTAPYTTEQARRSVLFRRENDLDWVFFRQWRLGRGWLDAAGRARTLEIFHDGLAIAMRKAVVARLYPDGFVWE
jgi:hypothetical protein